MAGKETLLQILGYASILGVMVAVWDESIAHGWLPPTVEGMVLIGGGGFAIFYLGYLYGQKQILREQEVQTAKTMLMLDQLQHFFGALRLDVIKDEEVRRIIDEGHDPTEIGLEVRADPDAYDVEEIDSDRVRAPPRARSDDDENAE